MSQGHSDAIRRVKGVLDGRQYTLPIEKAVERVRSGEEPALTAREKHLRDCYVVAEEGADLDRIRREIATMPNYFSDYDTKVTFISQEEMDRKHGRMPHGGFVMRTGRTGDGSGHAVEFSLRLESNPAFTGSVLLAYARARTAERGRDHRRENGLRHRPRLPSPRTAEELRRDQL